MSEMLEAATTERSVGYLDLRELDAAAMADLTIAVARVRDDVVNAGAGTFHDPSFFPGFIARIDDLLSLLQHARGVRKSTGG